MQTEAITLTPEVPDDRWQVEALYDLCFAPGRSALSSYRLRDGVDPIAPLCLTARDGAGILAGAIRHWPVCVAGHAVALLGPVAVHPTRQGEGLAIHWFWRIRDRWPTGLGPRDAGGRCAVLWQVWIYVVARCSDATADEPRPRVGDRRAKRCLARRDGCGDGVARLKIAPRPLICLR